MDAKLKNKILKAYKQNICDKEKEVDPEGERRWEDLFVGLAIGMGATAEEATDCSFYDEAFEMQLLAASDRKPNKEGEENE